eukprot:Filipodium_phascolosomae@DN2663_c0_g1_i7.p1
MLYGELLEGKRSVGCPKKRFKDSLKDSLEAFHSEPNRWKLSVSDPKSWRVIVASGALKAEESRLAKAEAKRKARKDKNISSLQSVTYTGGLRFDKAVMKAR